ncbi:MAG TPA: TraM recognition domain-containing protein [Rhodanobacteraceae bacterium]
MAAPWQRYEWAGSADAAGLLAAVGGGLLANPAFLHVPGAWLGGAALTAAGACGVTRRLMGLNRNRVFTSAVDIESHTSGLDADLRKDWPGVLLGYTVDTGKPLVIPWADWMGHTLIVGATGMGKTVLQEWLLFQQIVRGGGVVSIDGKIDVDNLEMLHRMAAYASREADLLVINPDDPDASNTYSPMLFGDADEIASRVLALIPSAETNPGADHYRQAANRSITTIVDTIRASKRAYTFLDLSILLQDEDALMYLDSLVPENSNEKGMFRLFLKGFLSSKGGDTHLDMNKVRELLGGAGGRLFQFAEGNFGKLTNTYTPDVNIFNAMTSNKIVYIALPTMGKAEAASNFGKMTVGDFRSAVAKIQHLPKSQRPWPPTLDSFDEAGSYMTQAWDRIFEQARSARQALVPAVQTYGNLEALGLPLREMIVGNTVSKVFFRIATGDTAKKVADLIGKEYVSMRGLSSGDSGGESAEAAVGSKLNVSRSGSAGHSDSYQERYRVPQEDLLALGRGSAVVVTNGNRVYHIKIPMLRFSKAFEQSVGPFHVNRLYHPHVRGLRLFDQFGRSAVSLTSNGDDKQKSSRGRGA